MNWKFLCLAMVLIVAVIILLASCRPLKTIQQEIADLSPDERQAFTEIISAAQLQLEKIRPVGILGIKNNPNSVCIEKGHIVALRLSNTHLDRLEYLSRLRELRVLWLDNDQLSAISGLNQASKLEELNLENNQISSLNGLENCVALKELRLASNKFESLSDIPLLKSLETLDLSYNRLHSLNNLDMLPNLKTLTLSHNLLETAQNIRGLKRLTELSLNHNSLNNITDLSDLPALSNLNLSYNQLTSIPMLNGLTALRDLNIAHNQLTELPPLSIANINSVANPIRKESQPHPANFVTDLPPSKGSSSGFTSTRIETNYEGYSYYLNQFDGVTIHYTDEECSRFGKDVVMEISVEKGRLRAYLNWENQGFVYAEALPGQPAKIPGQIICRTKPSQPGKSSLGNPNVGAIPLETVDGAAAGIRVKIYW